MLKRIPTFHGNRHTLHLLLQQLETDIFILKIYILRRSRVSSGNIVSDYGLDDRAIGVRSPAETKGFFLYPLCPDRLWGPTQPPVQWVPGVLSQGVKRGRGVMLTTHPHLVPRS
jgi:hypothetical protein